MGDSLDARHGKEFVSTRSRDETDDILKTGEPRIGRRESEPHSEGVSYIHDVLETNFPGDRTTWDLHHYFTINEEEIDLQFDVSWFKDLQIEHTLSSYRAAEHENQVPVLAINILSKSTWHDDVGEHVDECRLVGIPVYVIFAPYDVGSRMYKPPFLRAYVMNETGEYQVRELRKVTMQEGGAIDWDTVIDIGDRVPFQFGLSELVKKHDKGLSLYKLLLLDSREKRVFKSRLEQAELRANNLQEELDKLKNSIQY
jgi:Uma2 family endonuclease